jgi:imidazolonepropionase-like amidohydrolase
MISNGVLAMKALCLLSIILCAAACGVAGDAGGSETISVTAIIDVTVIPMDSERHLLNQTVVIRDGLIAELGPSGAIEVPASAERIDGTGLYLMPGLIDSHVHLRDPSELLSYLVHGVTTVVQLSGPSGNIPNVSELRERVGRGEILGPTIYMSGRILDGDPPIFPGVSTIVGTPDEAREAVIAQLSAGVDVIKVYNNLRTDELQAVTSVAHEHGLTVWGHIPRIDGRVTALQRALAAGLDVIAHGEEVFFTMLYRGVEDQLDRELVPTVDQELMTEAVRLIQENAVAVIPNLSFVAMTRAQLDDVQRLWTDPEAEFLHPTILNMWKTQNLTSRPDLRRFDLRERGKQVVVRQLTLALNDAGIPLFLGTDASAPGMFPGKSAHIELTELVAAGLTPFQALTTGTSNPGRFLTQHVRGNPPVGTVTVGSRADLLLLNADPLTDISHVARIAGVIVRGKWHAHGQIDSMRVGGGAESAR